MSNKLEIISGEGSFYNISIHGEVDIQTVEYLSDYFDSIIDCGTADLIIDCAKMSYIDSYGINVLVKQMKRVRQEGFCVYLLNMKWSIKRLFLITNLDTAFKIVG